MQKWVADFETATWLSDETYVWAWALCSIDNTEEIIIGNSMETFIEEISKVSGLYYFHNLRFDAEFILCYLFSNGFERIEDKREKRDKTFITLISDLGLFYSLEIYFKVNKTNIIKATIYDSLKIIPLKVEEIPKGFGIPYEKLEIDYNKPREKGHILDSSEEAYIKNDVRIVAIALKQLLEIGATKMTIGSNALKNFKDRYDKTSFNRFFPTLNREVFQKIKPCYKGGWTYLNPIYKDKENGKTINLDVNSLYPSVLRYEKMPYGEPVYYEGEYKTDNVYPLYIQRFYCSFKLKKNKLPTIQIKGSIYADNEYLTSRDDEIIELCLTSVDLKLFLDNYDTYFIEYIDGWKFKGKLGFFDEYIDEWIEVKNKATIEENKGMRTIAKLYLNSLYGKFSTGITATEKIPYFEDGKVLYRLGEEKEKEGLYLPIGAFITSYARNKTIRTANAIKEYSIEKYKKDAFIYSDTDSIKTTLPLEELTKFCEIDPVKLGAWKYEGTARRSKFVRQKTYLEEIWSEKDQEWEIQITCAGMPKDCYKYVEWKTFKEGFQCEGKLTPKHVKGGIILTPTLFTMKSSSNIKSIKGF